MKPWSCGARGAVPPAASALRNSASTSSRLSHDRQTSTSVLRVASATGFDVKVLKKSCVSSIAWMLPSSITRQAPWSLLNFGSKCRPRLSKKARERGRSATGRLT
jgi:hypothetical protein